MNGYNYKRLKTKVHIIVHEKSNKNNQLKIFLDRQIWPCFGLSDKIPDFFQPPGKLNYANRDLLCSVDAHV